MAYIGGAAASSTSAATSTTIPATAQVGQLCLLDLGWNSTSNFTSITGVTGWTQIDVEQLDGSVKKRLYYKFLASGDPGATVTFTISAAARNTIGVEVFNDVDTTSPIHAFAWALEPGTSASHAGPSLTTTVDECDIYSSVTDKAGALSSWTPPTGYTLRHTAFTIATAVSFGSASKKQATAGSVSTDHWVGDTATDKAIVAVVALTPTTSAYRDAVLADTPEAYYRLDEPAGATSAFDSSGNAHTATPGTTTNAPTFGATGISNDSDKATTYDGGDFVQLPASTAFNSASVTLEALIKTATTGFLSILIRDDGTTGQRTFQFRLNSGKLELIVFNSSATNSTVTGLATINDNAAHHVAATYDGTTVKLYVDGVLDNSGTPSLALCQPASETRGMMIGARNNSAVGSQYFNGTIDEVAYYKTALSATRIAAHAAAAGFGGPVTGTFDLSGVGALAASGVKIVSGSFTLAGAGAVADAGQKKVSGPFDLASAGTFGVVARKNASGGITISSAGTLAMAGTQAHGGPATFSGVGSLSLVAGRISNGTFVLTAAGALAAAGVKVAQGALSLDGAGDLALAGTKLASGALDLTGPSSLDIQGFAGHPGEPVSPPVWAELLVDAGTADVLEEPGYAELLVSSGWGDLTP